jgi:hypothetical protein
MNTKVKNKKKVSINSDALSMNGLTTSSGVGI